MSNMWDGIESVQADSRLPYLTPGTYRLAFKTAAKGVSNKTREEFLRIEYRVLEANGPSATPVGTTACVIFTRDKWGYYLRDIKLAVAAISGLNPNEVTGDIVAALVDHPEEAAGCEFQADVSNEPNKKDPTKVYTRHRFFAVPVDTSFEEPKKSKKSAA